MFPTGPRSLALLEIGFNGNDSEDVLKIEMKDNNEMRKLYYKNNEIIIVVEA